MFLIKGCEGTEASALNINGWHCLIFTVMGSSGQSDEDFENYAFILKFLLENTDADPKHKDKSNKDAIYYANKIHLYGGSLFEIIS